ncbi:5'-AMP-activated protein kinase subunit gamma-2 [Amphibalanus amphitrite]|uniref:5'-AMP-activated protein kinase subunit gamma-2 n=1 Tax=Amphibalanus amphitrite TaxID=1232801 RepID=A0A6A4WX14_AMPAM|nr:5'-AMP-activated protein kinase subunit gamma-2 [Amphibalanus amphitrite]
MEGGVAHQGYQPPPSPRHRWLPGWFSSDPDPALLKPPSTPATAGGRRNKRRARSASADQEERGEQRRSAYAETLDCLRLSLRAASSELQLHEGDGWPRAASGAAPRRVVLSRISDEPGGPTSITISQNDQRRVFDKFFDFHRCYDVMPHSSKLVVCDVQLPAFQAYEVLCANGVRAAPLWDGGLHQMVGMLTMTDLLTMLVEHAQAGTAAPRLSEWRVGRPHRPLLTVRPGDSLRTAVVVLLRHRVHRVPVEDPVTGDLLHLVTRQRLLRFLRLHQHELPRPALLQQTLRTLQCGTFEGLELARPDTTLLAAAGALLRRRISALPVVDAAGRLVRVCTKADLLSQAAAGEFGRLREPLSAAGPPGAVVTCRLEDTLGTLLERAGRAQVHRLIVVDHAGRVGGVVSLSDLLRVLLCGPDGAPAAEPAPDAERRLAPPSADQRPARSPGGSPSLRHSPVHAGHLVWETCHLLQSTISRRRLLGRQSSVTRQSHDGT